MLLLPEGGGGRVVRLQRPGSDAEFEALVDDGYVDDVLDVGGERWLIEYKTAQDVARQRSDVVRCPIISGCSGCRYCELQWEAREHLIRAGFPWPLRVLPPRGLGQR